MKNVVANQTTAGAVGVAGVVGLVEAIMEAAKVEPDWQVAIAAIVTFVFGGGLLWLIKYVRAEIFAAARYSDK